MNKLLVLGIGNMLLTDDGVGVFASQELMKEDWPEQVTIREGGTFTQDIFYSFKGYSHLLVLDVVHCGGKPGTLYRLTEDALIKDDKQRLSIHDIDLIDSLAHGRKAVRNQIRTPRARRGAQRLCNVEYRPFG